jgi:hypothetical protein
MTIKRVPCGYYFADLDLDGTTIPADAYHTPLVESWDHIDTSTDFSDEDPTIEVACNVRVRSLGGSL